VDPDDIEMLEDLIVASFNDATAKAEEIREQKLGKFAGLGV
ncbi:MAG: YbaB/EbfC family nucleoid-associated protein, partial [Clostridia bacterium]|nr:YbaB/EbfC family nucleoid-associated protein [Clostridia bacterium]